MICRLSDKVPRKSNTEFALWGGGFKGRQPGRRHLRIAELELIVISSHQATEHKRSLYGTWNH